ncbi:MAG: DUF2384 domain-containing protein [Candidatus Sumerlaeota bacterium]|nr:DUF2384 domain-containing protein [Candidatus Sumerlaeota bacterium]
MAISIKKNSKRPQLLDKYPGGTSHPSAFQLTPQIMRNRSETWNLLDIAGKPMQSTSAVIEFIKKGLPASSYSMLLAKLGVPTETLASIASIAPRTLSRRLKEGKFHSDESERLLRISSLFSKALTVMGSEARAQAWLKSPKRALDGKTPLEYADTECGAQEVQDLLGRIEHGVFS